MRFPILPDSPSPTDGQTLVYDDVLKRWVPATASGGGGGVGVLGGVAPPIGGNLIPFTTGSTAGRGPNVSGSAALGHHAVVVTDMTFSAAVVRMTTTEAGVNGKVLVYSSGADGWPDSLIAVTSEFSCASTGGRTASFDTPLALTPGQYWVFVITDVGDAVQFNAVRASGVNNVDPGGSLLVSGTPSLCVSADVGTYAAPSATAGAIDFAVDSAPLIGLKRSA